jgi:hypothetical protein
MPTVTMQQSQDMAYILLKSKRLDLEKEKETVSNKIYEAALKTIPFPIMALVKAGTHNRYLSFKSSIILDLTGANYEDKQVHFIGKRIPVDSNNYSSTIEIDNKLAEKWLTYRNKFRALKALAEKTAGVLKGLKTHKRVVEEFSQLETYLKTTIKKREVMNVDGLIKDIEKFPEGVK